MKLTSLQVEKVAKLANLPLSSDEEDKYSKQLSDILDYIDKLDQADTENIEPIFNVTPNFNVMAEDKVEESLPQDSALQNTKNKKDNCFVTKGVFEEQ